MTPTATAHVTLRDAVEADEDAPPWRESSNFTSVVSAAGSTKAAAQQAYMPFSTGPRRFFSLTGTSAH